jgi:hypothetical protein
MQPTGPNTERNAEAPDVAVGAHVAADLDDIMDLVEI